MPKKQAETLLNDLVDTIVGHLKKGERIRNGGLGHLAGAQNARPAWDAIPRRANRSRSKASKKVAFRASKELKEAV